MDSFWMSEQFVALLIAGIIFLVTIVLVVNQRISFSVTLLLLLFSLAAGFSIGNQSHLKNYFQKKTDSHEAFKKQFIQAFEDLRDEVDTERDNLLQLTDEVWKIFNQVDAQKQKLQSFIDETRSHLNTDFHSDNDNS